MQNRVFLSRSLTVVENSLEKSMAYSETLTVVESSTGI